MCVCVCVCVCVWKGGCTFVCVSGLGGVGKSMWVSSSLGNVYTNKSLQGSQEPISRVQKKTEYTVDFLNS
jgi:excinuclease UvrABC ATPase subunit